MTPKNYTPFNNNLANYNTVSKPHEAEPIIANTESLKIKEVVEHKIKDQEVKIHVKVRHETIKLPPDLKKIGIQADKTAKFNDYKNISIPISDDKVIKGLHAPITSALRWLATFAVYLLKKAHICLKVVGGKVVRVVR